MSENIERHEMTLRPVLYRIPKMDAVTVRRDVTLEGSDGATLAMDLYLPPGSTTDASLPAVVFVSGYPDPGMEAMLGCKLKEWAAYTSWGRLTAASGLAAITYTNRDPARDARALLAHLREHGTSLGIDAERIGLWACSGNVPNALSLLIEGGDPAPRCAVLCYGFMLDGEESRVVAEAARAFGFAAPHASGSAGDLPGDVPLLLVRAGRDETPGVNETIDRFVREALAADLPLALVNHAGAPHAFDLLDDSDETRTVVAQILRFLDERLIR